MLLFANCLIASSKILWAKTGASSKELDLRDQKAVRDFIAKENPDVIIYAAARVGGILAIMIFHINL